MNKKTWMQGLVVVLGLSLTSCSQDSGWNNQAESRQGYLSLSLNTNTDFVVKTRAVNEEQYKNVSNYDVVVLDQNGVEKLNCKGYEVASKMPLTMNIGSYTITASYGKESAASRNDFYVFGSVAGSIKAEQKENVVVTCTPTCGKISVNFGENMATYFSDYNVIFTGTEALGNNTIEWLKGDTEPWYVKLNPTEETIKFTITTTTRDEYVNGNNEQVATKNGTFKLSRNKAYKININPAYTPTTEGTVNITVTIDESTNDKPVDIEVPVDWV